MWKDRNDVMQCKELQLKQQYRFGLKCTLVEADDKIETSIKICNSSKRVSAWRNSFSSVCFGGNKEWRSVTGREWNPFAVQRASAVCCSGWFILSPHSHRLAVPLWGGQTLDEIMSQVVFRDGSSFKHVLHRRVALCQRKVVWREQDRSKTLQKI